MKIQPEPVSNSELQQPPESPNLEMQQSGEPQNWQTEQSEELPNWQTEQSGSLGGFSTEIQPAETIISYQEEQVNRLSNEPNPLVFSTSQEYNRLQTDDKKNFLQKKLSSFYKFSSNKSLQQTSQNQTVTESDNAKLALYSTRRY